MSTCGGKTPLVPFLPNYYSNLTWICGRKWIGGCKVVVLLGIISIVVGVEAPEVVVVLFKQPVSVNLNYCITMTFSSQKLGIDC